MLHEDAPEVRLRKIEDWGIPSGAKEAYAFALSASALSGACQHFSSWCTLRQRRDRRVCRGGAWLGAVITAFETMRQRTS